jgi:hypothetical protein
MYFILSYSNLVPLNPVVICRHIVTIDVNMLLGGKLFSLGALNRMTWYLLLVVPQWRGGAAAVAV